MTQNNDYDNLGSNCFDKISASENIIQNNEQESGANDHELENDTENNSESDMDWTTVRRKNKRTRSGSNDAEKIDLDVTVSANKKSKNLVQPQTMDKNWTQNQSENLEIMIGMN